MDEPFSGLDNRLRDGIRDQTLDILKEEGTAVLLVTHEPDEAMRMADRIALMRAGRIVQQGPPRSLYGSPADREAAQFFSEINLVRGRVADGAAETAFGRFAAPGLAEGTAAEVVIRPQHLRLDFDRGGAGPVPTADDGTPARARVLRARFVGDRSLVELALETAAVGVAVGVAVRMADGAATMKAEVPGVFLPPPGTAFWLSLPRARCFVFPAGPLHEAVSTAA